MSFRVGGMLMIIPTLVVAIHLAWKSRNTLSDLFHNIAVCLWISANAIWMTGEFFYNDGFRPYATVLFAIGLVVVGFYYLIHLPKTRAQATETTELVPAAEPEAKAA
jgi:uncharacterized membrane protein (GlpM family)